MLQTDVYSVMKLKSNILLFVNICCNISWYPLHWHHNEHDGVSNHWRLRFFYLTFYSGRDQRIYQSSVSLCLCEGNSPVTSDFPTQKASNVENASIWWCHHVHKSIWTCSGKFGYKPIYSCPLADIKVVNVSAFRHFFMTLLHNVFILNAKCFCSHTMYGLLYVYCFAHFYDIMSY